VPRALPGVSGGLTRSQRRETPPEVPGGVRRMESPGQGQIRGAAPSLRLARRPAKGPVGPVRASASPLPAARASWASGARGPAARAPSCLAGLADLEDLGAAVGADAFGRRPPVLHGDLLGILDLLLGAALHTVSFHFSPSLHRVCCTPCSYVLPGIPACTCLDEKRILRYLSPGGRTSRP
jgi:hypothetical protein